MASTPLDEILAAVRVRLETRKSAAQDRAHSIKQAADAYVAAVEREALSELAGKVDVGIAPSLGPSARDAARALSAAVSELPELRAPARPAPTPQAPVESPKRRPPERRIKVVVLGGVAKGEKLSRIEVMRGMDIEWTSADKAGKNAIRNLEGRILDGRVAGIVVLDGFISHTQSEPVVRAARQTGTPLAYADKGGIAAIEKAVTEIEAGLARRASRD
jgi:hypothetical protein